MPVPSTADQLLELACKSGLLESQRLEAYLLRRRAAGDLPDRPKELAAALVRDGLLTHFQADQLLRGKWRNFILSGKYKILGPIGSGGMGHVFLCEHQVMRRRVAVKVLPAHTADPSALERFRREARAVAQLDHTNIVGGHDIDQDGNLHFLVMEYIDGSTFYSVVKKCGPLSPLRAAHYLRQAALGLQHAHEAGLVHRDIKPANLLLDRSGTVKVLDLGLARFFHDEADDLSRRNVDSPMGTSDYMAPEQALDSHQVDIRADIYSLGATGYFLLTGQGPFQGRSSLQKLMCHQFETPKPVRELRPEVPENLVAVIERMMAKEPTDRYQVPAEVAEALAAWTNSPIPPPPPEEMPELVSSIRGKAFAEAASNMPTFLYAPAASPRPAAAVAAGATPPSGSQLPTLPVPNEDSEPRAAAALHADVALESGPALQPTRIPSFELEASSDTGHAAPERPRMSWRHPRLRWAALAAAVVLLVGGGAAGFVAYRIASSRVPPPADDPTPPQPPVAAAEASPLRLLVPVYSYPAGGGLTVWDRILESPVASRTVVIVNTNSGPGTMPDPNYAKVLERARRSGVTTIGYVSTKYAKRPLHEVKGDVDRWMQFYPGIQGMFFDEQASKADQVLYYAALYEYVRKERGLTLVVTNPGTVCAEEYVSRPAADVVCLFEVTKDFSTYRRPVWTDRYPAHRFAALICEVETAAQMKQFIRDMRDRKLGYCFITDAKEPNPWDRVPSYWEAEVEAVQKAGAPE